MYIGTYNILFDEVSFKVKASHANIMAKILTHSAQASETRKKDICADDCT